MGLLRDRMAEDLKLCGYSRDTVRADAYRPFSYPNYFGLRERNQVFSGLLARSNWSNQFYVSIDGGRIETVRGEPVSGNYFSVLGVNPYIQQAIQGLIIVAAVALTINRAQLKIIK